MPGPRRLREIWARLNSPCTKADLVTISVAVLLIPAILMIAKRLGVF